MNGNSRWQRELFLINREFCLPLWAFHSWSLREMDRQLLPPRMAPTHPCQTTSNRISNSDSTQRQLAARNILHRARHSTAQHSTHELCHDPTRQTTHAKQPHDTTQRICVNTTQQKKNNTACHVSCQHTKHQHNRYIASKQNARIGRLPAAARQYQ